MAGSHQDIIEKLTRSPRITSVPWAGSRRGPESVRILPSLRRNMRLGGINSQEQTGAASPKSIQAEPYSETPKIIYISSSRSPPQTQKGTRSPRAESAVGQPPVAVAVRKRNDQMPREANAKQQHQHKQLPNRHFHHPQCCVLMIFDNRRNQHTSTKNNDNTTTDSKTSKSTT